MLLLLKCWDDETTKKKRNNNNEKIKLKEKSFEDENKKNYIKKKVNCSVFENIFLILLFHYMEEQKCIKEY